MGGHAGLGTHISVRHGQQRSEHGTVCSAGEKGKTTRAAGGRRAAVEGLEGRVLLSAAYSVMDLGTLMDRRVLRFQSMTKGRLGQGRYGRGVGFGVSV